MERASSACNYAVSSIEKATLPVALGTCQAWSGPPVADRQWLLYMQSLQYRASAILVVLRTWSGPPVAVIHAESPV